LDDFQDGKIVFVTFELFPLTGGGIGRAIYNIIMSMSARDRQRVVVILLGENAAEQPVPPRLSDIEIVFANTSDENDLFKDGLLHPPRWAYRQTEWQWRSFVAHRALRGVQKHHRVDYVEFPDWGGLAYCALQHRRSSNDYDALQIAVRLHGPHGVLLNSERYYVTKHDLAIFDIERAAIAQCDLVITQTEPYFDTVCKTFDFDPKRFKERLIYSPLPVSIDTVVRKPHTSKRPILFTSKFQNIKRPDIFTAGVCEYLNQAADGTREAVFCARITEDETRDEILKSIPTQLRPQFSFRPELQGAERDWLISQSIVVVSSACESYCLAAYEASLLGAIVILNSTNPSFGNNTLWHDQLNCIKFDGTVQDLARALHLADRIHDGLAPVVIPEFSPTWDRQSNIHQKAKTTAGRSQDVSIVVYGLKDLKSALFTLKNVTALQYANIDLVIICDDEVDQRLSVFLARFEEDNASVRLIRKHRNISLPASLNEAVDIARGDFILFIAAGHQIHPEFIRGALHAFETDTDVAVVGSAVGIFECRPDRSEDQTTQRAFPEYTVLIGESSLSALLENCMIGSSGFYRKSILVENRFFEELADGFFWAHCIQAVRQGKSIINLPAVLAYEPRAIRDHQNRDWAEGRLKHDVLRRALASSDKGNSEFLLFCLAQRSENFSAVASMIAPQLVEQPAPPGHLNLIFSRSARKLASGRFSPWTGLRSRVWPHHKTYVALKMSGAFDEAWYLAQYEDVVLSEVDPLKHFVEHGAAEGRMPNAYFNTAGYLDRYPDVRSSGMNPLLHYLKYGIKENRDIS
jgi:glycosyltransferase involved in cell wall biosynthesis